jgi:acyl-CoA synthetase (AMP-forming)/AMP-acid ligase II
LAGTTLRLVALGGEACVVADVRALWAAAPQVRVFNRYGPTETTIAVTHIELTPELVASGSVPLGRPHPGVSFHLVGDDGQVIDGPGRVGELYIGGDQLMAGYWGAPELSARVLRADVVPGVRLYRTGDLVYRNDQGDYVYFDRADRVVKRSGVRVSLVELTEVLTGLAGVSAAACLAYDDEGQVGIVAFVVLAASGSASVGGGRVGSGLREAALDRLPQAMLPDRFELVGSLPLTASSKVDERRLLAEAGLRPPSPPAGPAAHPSG